VPERLRVEAVHDPEIPIAVPHSIVDSQMMPRHLRIAPRRSRAVVAAPLTCLPAANDNPDFVSRFRWRPNRGGHLQVAAFLYGVRVNKDQHRLRTRQIQIGSTFRF